MWKKILLPLGAVLLGWMIWASISRNQREATRNRCAVEGQAAVEQFLRETPDPRLASLGAFKHLQGGGWMPPVWNIQGYEFITLTRFATFERGVIPMKIHVTEPRAGDRANHTLGTPRLESYSPIQGATVFISHPDLY
jgi:hypothetical protein